MEPAGERAAGERRRKSLAWIGSAALFTATINAAHAVESRPAAWAIYGVAALIATAGLAAYLGVIGGSRQDLGDE